MARVRDRATFEALGRVQWRRCGPVGVRFVPGDGGGPPRVAYAVGRAAGNAVVRNRVRRRLRAAVASAAEHLEPGGAYLFAGGFEVVSMPGPELRDAVAALVAGADR